MKDYQKFQIPDENKEKHIICEVNWNAKDPKTNNCQVIRLTFPSGGNVIVKREYLNQILFAIGNPEDQRKLIPQKIESVHWLETTLGLKATKDIQNGEMINFPIKISVPCTVVKEIIGEDNWKKDVQQEKLKDAFRNPVHKLIKS